MKNLSPSDFLGQYSEFESLDVAKIQTALDQAATYCPPDVWKEKRNQAIALIAAHSLAVRWLQIGVIAASAVQNAKGRSEAKSSNSDSWFNETAWGREFLQLRKSIIVTGFCI
jgi:deoxyribodipyrimidine photolyase